MFGLLTQQELKKINSFSFGNQYEDNKLILVYILSSIFIYIAVFLILYYTKSKFVIKSNNTNSKKVDIRKVALYSLISVPVTIIFIYINFTEFL